MTTTQATEKPFSTTVRLPDELAEWLKRAASESLRSVNSEVVWQLQQARRRDQQQRAPEPAGTSSGALR